MGVYIGLGANLDHPRFGNPRRTLGRALRRLADVGVQPVRVSRWYRSSPVPRSDQPWYVNAVAEVLTGLGPDATLAALHRIEDAFGRVRAARDAARWIDLDLLDYHYIIKCNKDRGLSALPHPKLHLRAFVLLPLADLDPTWRHPVLRESITSLIGQLPREQEIAPLND
jgi:2-amino-4-hydroxy-6-hydroxymethyldihydropteridine diphosphokinase